MVARILSLSKWGGPLSAYFDLIGEDSGAERNAAMGRGLALEESVLAMWAQKTGGTWARSDGWRQVVDGKVLAPSLPHAHASLDALGQPGHNYHPDIDDAPRYRILDAKTASIHEMGEDWGPDGSDRLPADYQIQGLWYLGVCRAAGMNVADEALFPTLVGPEAELQWAARLVTKTERPLALSDIEGTGLELRTYHVAWDAELFEEVNRKVLAFLREHVERRRPPEPGPGDLLQRDLRAVAKSLRAELGRVLEFDALPPHEQALLLELLDANRQRKAWATAEEQAAARVRLLMATAEEVRGLPGGARVTWADRQSGMRVFQVKEPRR